MSFGLMNFGFVDFGKNFIVKDFNGISTEQYHILEIDQETGNIALDTETNKYLRGDLI